MKTIFENKEQYLAMKAQWAAASKSSKCKSTVEPCDEYIDDPKKGFCVSRGTGIHQVPGWMQAQHHILYNLLRNKPANTGFTAITNPNKKISKPDEFEHSMMMLRHLQRQTKDIVKAESKNKYTVGILFKGILAKITDEPVDKNNWEYKHTIQRLDVLLAPFGDTITPEMFAKMDIPAKICTPQPLSYKGDVVYEACLTV